MYTCVLSLLFLVWMNCLKPETTIRAHRWADAEYLSHERGPHEVRGIESAAREHESHRESTCFASEKVKRCFRRKFC